MNHGPTHYNYQALDKLLTDASDPKEVGDQLDEIMQTLAEHAAEDGDYHTRLGEHYYLIRLMRDIFWKLQPAPETPTLTVLRSDQPEEKINRA